MDTATIDENNAHVTKSYEVLAEKTGANLQQMIDKDKNTYNTIRNNDSNQLASITTNLKNNLTKMTNNVKTSVNAMVNKNKTGLNTARTTSQTQLAAMNTILRSRLTSMTNNVKTSVNAMVNKNAVGLNAARNTTKIQLKSITSATVKANQKMIAAWNTMKNGIVSAANQIKSESTSHFNSLSSTIGSFYRKLQNPSGFGAGPGTGKVSSIRGPNSNNGFRRIAKVMRQYAMPEYVTLGDIRRNPLISTRNIGSYIKSQNGKYSLSDLIRSGNVVDLPLGLADPKNKGAGWTSGVPKHVSKIKETSKNWSMKGPVILGQYPTSIGFKVREFMNGTPSIDFATFKQIAEDVFSQTRYDFYYDDQKHGSWLGALRDGALNCYHGALAIINMANAMGLSGSLVHGHWNKTGHFWANIAGHKMDVTGWQQQRNWTPAASHAGPAPKSWSFEDLFTELKKELSDNDSNEIVINPNNGEITINGECKVVHEFINLPENITAEEVARLINETSSNESWIKNLVKNTVFQKLDLTEKARIESKNRRARGMING
jgi:hypothetical protein